MSDRPAAWRLRRASPPMLLHRCVLAAGSGLLVAAGCHDVIDFEQRVYAPECEAGEQACEDGAVLACSDGQWRELAPCDDPSATCHDGACRVPCTSDEPQRCIADTPQACREGFWEDQPSCSGPTPVCAGGVCKQELMALPVSGGHSHTCVVGSGGVYCWGQNADGQLGLPGIEAHPSPARVEGLPEGVVELALGWSHTCARTVIGDVWCWGLDSHGELGSGNSRGGLQSPTRVLGVPAAKAIRASEHRTCILTTTGAAWCFGRNNGGEISLPVDEDPHEPAPISGLTGLVDIAMGTELTCGVRQDGSAACVGDWSRLRELPLDDIVELRMNDLHHCAVREGGKLSCWGIDQFGELGNGLPFEASSAPDELPLQGVEDVTTGWRHTCLLAGGTISCVGYGDFGQLGNGNPTPYSGTFVPVSLAEPASDIAANFSVTCAKVGRRDLYCWGQNTSGAIGDGTFEDRSAPVKVDWDTP